MTTLRSRRAGSPLQAAQEPVCCTREEELEVERKGTRQGAPIRFLTAPGGGVVSSPTLRPGWAARWTRERRPVSQEREDASPGGGARAPASVAGEACPGPLADSDDAASFAVLEDVEVLRHRAGIDVVAADRYRFVRIDGSVCFVPM